MRSSAVLSFFLVSPSQTAAGFLFELKGKRLEVGRLR
jgi:hypothetical protein